MNMLEGIAGARLVLLSVYTGDYNWAMPDAK